MNTTEVQIKAARQHLAHRILTEDFSYQMAKRLDEHAHIGEFLEWTPPPMELIGEIQSRLGLLGQRVSRADISADCADIANMLLRYSQLYGS